MRVLVFNCSPLSCFARAGRLDLLKRLADGYDTVTVRPVIEELELGYATYPALRDVTQLPWLRQERIDEIRDLLLFAEYARRLVVGRRNVGEASVLAWAESRAAIAVLDDQTGVQCGKDRGVTIKRTLALVARGIRRGIVSESEAVRLVDDLIRGGARFPTAAASDFIRWANQVGLLP